MEKFVITDFSSVFIAHDKKGQKKEFVDRRYACFIITVRGKIRFSYANGVVISEAGKPVFLPKGFSYTNECLESAESYVFNFITLSSYNEPLQLSSVSDTIVRKCYDRIRPKTFSPSLQNTLSILESLYFLASYLMSSCKNEMSVHPTVTTAMDFMRQYGGRAGLTMNEIACHCCISEVYLRKLFKKHLGISPFRKLTEIRMEKAALLIAEKRPLAEVYESVGYSDLSQFSRAYKRHFGYSPTKSV